RAQGDGGIRCPRAAVRRGALRVGDIERGQEPRAAVELREGGHGARRVHRRHPVPGNAELREEDSGEGGRLSPPVWHGCGGGRGGGRRDAGRRARRCPPGQQGERFIVARHDEEEGDAATREEEDAVAEDEESWVSLRATSLVQR